MHDVIHRLAKCLRLLFGSGTDIHRAGTGTHQPPTPAPRPAVRPSLPLHRSPYGLALPLDGSATALVRPYVTASDQERAVQRRRRLALVLAADFGIDLDQHLVGARVVGG
ncbi:hypothetical protein K8369_11840 [Streptomyces sp. PSKA30]|nr:hypothetical protein [Streptomyces sp. PSKA30]